MYTTGPRTFHLLHHHFPVRSSARLSQLNKCTIASGVPPRDRSVKRKVSLRFCEICGKLLLLLVGCSSAQACPCHRLDQQVLSLAGTGSGLLSCPVCQGSGEVTTQVQGAAKERRLTSTDM